MDTTSRRGRRIRARRVVRMRRVGRAAVATVLAALLAIGGAVAPATAAGVVNATIVPSGETYDGNAVFAPGVDYTLNLQYGKMDDGQVVRITAPSGVTIPDSSLVVPSGSTAVASLTRDGGDILLTFANPFPASVD